MKKMSKLFLAFLIVISLTGCVKYNVNMEVKNDKSVTLEIIYGMEVDSSMMGDDTTDSSDSSSDVSTEDYAWIEELGYKVEEFEETKDDVTTAGVKITKTFDNIDDITADKKTTVNFVTLFEKENKDQIKDAKFFYKDGSNYAANFVFDFVEEGEDRSEYETYDAYITDLKYKIKLPVEAASHNATSVSEDGKELTWTLKYSKANEVNFAFPLGSSINWVIVIAAVAAAVVIIAVIVMLTKKKKPVQGQPMMNNGQAPMAPGVNPMGVDQAQQPMANPAMQPDLNQQPMITPEPVATPEPFVQNATEANPMSVDQPGAENPLLSVNPVPVADTPAVENVNNEAVQTLEAAPGEAPVVETPAPEVANDVVIPAVDVETKNETTGQ